MKSTFNRLGNYIAEIDNRNKDMSVSNLLGVSISKDFMPSVANVIGTDLSNYKIISKKQFACSLMQVSRDGGIAVSLYKEDKPSIMSPAYHLFEIVSDELLPEYLEMIMISSEFDRAAVFYAIGGVRGTLTWEEFCDMRIPVPSIEEQRKIVHDYKVITDRIELLKKINENLDETLVNHFFSLELNDSKTIKELTKNSIGVRTGKSPRDSNDSKNSRFQYPVIGASGIMGYTSLHLYDGRVVSTGRVGTIGKVMLWENRNWFTDNSLVIESEYIATIYSVLKTFNFGEITGGSSNPKITQTELNESKVSIPNSESIAKFELFAKPIIELIFTNKKEIISLENLSQVLLSNISKEVA